jgi:hypothetical protein
LFFRFRECRKELSGVALAFFRAGCGLRNLSSVKPLEKNAPAFSLNHQPRKNARKNLNAGACSVFCVDGSGQLAEIVTAWRYLSSLFFVLGSVGSFRRGSVVFSSSSIAPKTQP